MPKTFEELAIMIAKRDGISYEEGLRAVRDCMSELEFALVDGDIDEAEEILKDHLGLEPDFLDVFIL